MPKRCEIKSGERFAMLVVLGPTENLKKHSAHLCLCDCGKTISIRSSTLRQGIRKSCGCQAHPIKQGGNRQFILQHMRLFTVWCHMRRRCRALNHSEYKNYGGRGIMVCDRWNDFRNFFADVGDPPDGLELDRINNDGNYEPENVRWATRKEQCLNMRRNRRIEWQGENLTLSQWAEKLRINPSTLNKRINRSGWDPIVALQTSVQNRKAAHE